MVTKAQKTKFINARLGAFESPWDHRHYRVTPATVKEAAQLPVEYNGLIDYAPTDDFPNQGNVGSCVGWDGSVVMEITNTLLQEYASRTGNNKLLGYIHTDLSAGWLYHWSRIHAGVPDWQEGSTNLGLMKALLKEGTASEALCPTDIISPFTYEPKEGAEEEAKKFAIDSYWNVNSNPNDIKSAIYGLTHEAPYKMADDSVGKIPLVSAFPVYDTFSDGYDDGIIPNPKASDKLRGGHSSAIIGWKIIDGKEYYINLGSWGKDVGDNGMFYIPSDYPFYANSWFLVHNGPSTPPDPPTPPTPPTPNPCQISTLVTAPINLGLRLFGRKGRVMYMTPGR